MSDTASSPQRFLIATAISRYPKAPQWDRPALAGARQQIVDLFTRKLGYRHVSDLGLDPTRDQLTQRLRAFCRSSDRQPDDLIAVYIAAHGEVLEEGREHLLLTSETDPDDIADALPTAELARKMLLGTNARRVLLMLDACYSSRGGNELAAAALARMTESWTDAGSGLAVIASSQPDEQAQTGAFPRLLQAAVDSLATAGYVPATLALDAVVNAMNANTERPGFQRIGLTQVGLTGEVPPFLPNPRHSRRMYDVDLAIQQASEWEAQAERREVEYSSRLLVRAMGSPDVSGGWWFVGRHTALVDITSWLSHPDPRRPVLAVTAAPGSGKTAVLGLIATLTHRARRGTVPRDALGLPEAAIPDPDAVDVTIYAQNLTTDQVLQGIAAAARVTAGTAGELLAALTGREQPFTILIDAVDEAADPEQLASHLSSLASYAAGRLRLLVGTRPHLLSRLGIRREDSIDLDADRYADPGALAVYAARGLLGPSAHSPYRNAASEKVREVAWAVAEAAGASFLVARIASSTLAAAESVVADPQDLSWRARLPRAAGDAVRQDLAARLGEDAHRAQDLLRPLAFAEGQGLPWEDLWAPLASAVAGHPYTDEDILWLRRAAGSYVVEATEAGRSVYRLYHQALAEHLQENVDLLAVDSAFVDVLLSRVPLNDDGRKNWERSHPYIRYHLASHAAACYELDSLLLDPGFQLAAAQPELLAHLSDAQGDEAIAAAAAYQGAAHHLRDKPAEDHASYLEIAARRIHADAFAGSIGRVKPHRAWSAQWVNWQTETPHKILARHAEAAVSVDCVSIAGGEWKCAVSLGLDHSLQTIDLISRQSVAMPWEAGNGAILMMDCMSSAESKQFVITGTPWDGIILWDLSDEDEIRARRFPDSLEDVRMVNLVELSDGRAVAVFGCHDKIIRARDVVTDEKIGRTIVNFTEQGHRFWTMACASLPNERVLIVTANEDAPVRVWDLHTGEPAGPPITGHPGRIMELSCVQLPDGKTVVLTGGDDSAVRVWNPVTGEPACAPLAGHTSGVSALDCAILSDGRTIAITGADDGIIRTWDLTTGEMIGAPISGHPGSVRAISHTDLEDDRTVIITAGNDGTVRMWDLPTENGSADTWEPPARIYSMVRAQVSGKRDVIVGGHKDGTVRVWDLDTGQALNEPIIAHSKIIWAVSYGRTSEGEDIIISASLDGTTRLWDLNTHQAIGQLSQPLGITFALACTHLPDGRAVIITGGSDPVMRIWDLQNGSKLSQVRTRRKGSTGPRSILEITAITSTSLPDGRRVVVTGHETGTIRVWDLVTGQRVGVPMTSRDPGQPSNAEISAIACTRIPDGRVVAVTGSEDTTRSRVRAWDLNTGRLLARTYLNTSWIKAVCCAVLPDGRTVAITGDDVLRIWNLDTIGNPHTENDWMPIKEIDLDAPIMALAVGPEFSIVAGTEHGIVGLTLDQSNTDLSAQSAWSRRSESRPSVRRPGCTEHRTLDW